MELDDDSTYAVIVSESGEAQVFKLGCIDGSCDSNQLVMLVNRHMAGSESADVMSEESNTKVEEPSVEDRRRETEIKFPDASVERKKWIAEAADSRNGLEISQKSNGPRRFRSPRKLSKKEYSNGNRRMILPTNAADITEADYNDAEIDARGSANDNDSYYGSMNTQSKFVWTRTMTRDLIDGYRALTVDFRNPQKRQREVWESLAKELRRKGYADITGDMCDRKWRNLKSTFKTIYYSDRKLYSKRRWEYYDEFKILFAPDVRGTRMERQSRTIPPPEYESSHDKTSLSEDVPDDLHRVRNLTPMLKQPRWFSGFYRSVYKTELAMKLAHEQHDERMRIKNRTCELIGRLIGTV